MVTLIVSGKGLQPLPKQALKDSICATLEGLQQVTPHTVTSCQVGAACRCGGVPCLRRAGGVCRQHFVLCSNL